MSAQSLTAPLSAPDTHPQTGSVEQHSLPQSIVLHLLPGALATVVYIIAAPIVLSIGFPSLLALYLPMTLAITIFELGYLFYRGQKMNGRISLGGVVNYREPMPLWQYFALAIPLFVVGIVLTGLVSPIDNLVAQSFFSWLPDWFMVRDLTQFTQYSRSALIITLALGLVMNGFVGPIVEELYFRGHLLPRIQRFGKWAPLLNAVLFSLYHFWQPWQFFSRLTYLLPWVYVAWWKRNIYIAIVMHCLGNLISVVVLSAMLLR